MSTDPDEWPRPAPVSEALSIAPWGLDDVAQIIAELLSGKSVAARTGEIAEQVLVALDCDPTWAHARVHYALTGEWLLHG